MKMDVLVNVIIELKEKHIKIISLLNLVLNKCETTFSPDEVSDLMREYSLLTSVQKYDRNQISLLIQGVEAYDCDTYKHCKDAVLNTSEGTEESTLYGNVSFESPDESEDIHILHANIDHTYGLADKVRSHTHKVRSHTHKVKVRTQMKVKERSQVNKPQAVIRETAPDGILLKTPDQTVHHGPPVRTMLNTPERTVLITPNGSMVHILDGTMVNKPDSCSLLNKPDCHSLLNKLDCRSLLNKPDGTVLTKPDGTSTTRLNMPDTKFTRSFSKQTSKWHHFADGMWRCNVCPKTFKRKDSSYKHQQIHSGVTYKCEVCRVEFKTKHYLRKHLRTHNNIDKYKCEFCFLGFKTTSSLQRHIQKIHKSHRYVCDLCNRRFHTVFDCKKHMVRQHAKVGPLAQCNLCQFSTYEKYKLKAHQQHIHSDLRPKYGPCTFCGKYLLSKSSFHTHTQTHTRTIKDKKCDKCDAVYWNLSALRKHKLTHQNYKPFKCDICPLAFRRNYDLQSHKRVHCPKEERPSYVCNLCSRSYTNMQSLKTHTERAHTGGARPFTCDACGNSFKVMKDLKAHKRKYLH